MAVRAAILVLALVLLFASGCGGDPQRRGGGGTTTGTTTVTTPPLESVEAVEPAAPAGAGSAKPSVPDDEPAEDDAGEDDASPSRAERRAAARVAALVGWKRSHGGTGSDSTDGPFWEGWITADGCEVKRLLVGREAVERSLRDAPRRPVTRRFRDSWWTVTNPAGNLGFRGHGVEGQGTKNWDTDCHRTLGAAFAAIPGTL